MVRLKKVQKKGELKKDLPPTPPEDKYADRIYAVQGSAKEIEEEIRTHDGSTGTTEIERDIKRLRK